MASPVDTSVKFYRNDFPGAPVHDGIPGAFIGVLDACLVSGFGARTATSLVVSGGVATITLPTDAKNPNLLYSVVEVAGVTSGMTDLNGEQRITGATATTLTYSTAVGDGAAAGTITVKTAPAGWVKLHTGTNKAVYQSASVESTGMCLRVDDADGYNARVRGFESMTDVDTGSGPFPAAGRSANGGRWIKSYAANPRWDMAADARAILYSPVPTSGSSPSQIGQATYFFGDFLPHKSGDAFACALLSSAADADPYSLHYGSALYGGQGGAAGMCSFPRSHSGLGAEIAAFVCPVSGGNAAISGNDGSFGVYPAPADGSLRLSQMQATETAALGASSAVLRGYLPGVYYAPQSGLGAHFQRGDTVIFGDKRMYCVSANSVMLDTGVAGGRGFIDITGPWR